MPKSHSLRWVWLAAWVHAVAVCGPVRAESSAQKDRLEGLSKDDLTRLEPELARGPVALIEFADMERDQLPAVNIVVPIRASSEVVTQVLTDPASFPRFMPTLDSVEIVAKHDNSIVYDWAFNLALLRMRGRNLMTVYPAPKGRPEAGTRITIDSQEGDLGRGRMLFRVHPRGQDSLLVVSLRVDLREANYVARQIAKAARSVNRSANIALAFSMALHSQLESERREPRTRAPLPAPVFHKPEFQLQRLIPLLSRGDLLLFETQGKLLQQVSVLGVVMQSESKVQTVMRDAKGFGNSLVPGSKAEIVAQKDATTTFDWELNLPLVGVSGQMQMLDQGRKLSIEATQGALLGGRWWFEVTPVTPGATLVTGWAHFGFDNTTWLLEKLVSADAYLGHGMIGASELMLMRAVRSRASQ